MATMKSDHYHGARRIQGLVDRLNELKATSAAATTGRRHDEPLRPARLCGGPFAFYRKVARPRTVVMPWCG
jgi:hypothetical protein